MKIEFTYPVENKLPVVKAVREVLNLGLKEAKDAVDAGEIEVNNVDVKELCSAITSAGGKIMPIEEHYKFVEDVVVPKYENPIMRLIKDIVANDEDDRINDTFVVTNCANEICIESCISISERLYQQLQISGKDEAKVVQQHIRLVVAFKTLPAEYNKNGHPTSVLVLHVPENHNSTSDIEALSEAATTIHETILKAVSKTSVFDNIEKDLKPFYDE